MHVSLHGTFACMHLLLIIFLFSSCFRLLSLFPIIRYSRSAFSTIFIFHFIFLYFCNLVFIFLLFFFSSFISLTIGAETCSGIGCRVRVPLRLSLLRTAHDTQGTHALTISYIIRYYVRTYAFFRDVFRGRDSYRTLSSCPITF